MDEIQRDKWVEIDVDAVMHNLRAVRSILTNHTRLIAVIKANAYGQGGAQIARLMEEQGVDFFAVTFLEEAIRLREAGIQADIMLLSPLFLKEQVIEALQHEIILTITSRGDVRLLKEVLSNSEKHAAIHVKIDTGLGRFGFMEDEAVEICLDLQSYPGVDLQGIYTHMADGVNASYTNRQFSLFTGIIKHLEDQGVYFKLKHCANSSVFLLYPQMHLDAVRIGTLLSGYIPVGLKQPVLKLRDPMKFKCRIVSLRRLPKGSYLGYFRTYRLPGEAQVAVIPAGYIDGLGLEVGNRPAGVIDLLKIALKMVLAYMGIRGFARTVSIKGKPYPVKGKIFMQMALVEIPTDDDIQVGDEVEIPARKTLISKEIVRIYVRDGQIIRNYQS